MYREWDGSGSLVAFVWSLNGARRHLNSGQKAAIAVEMLPLLKAEVAKVTGTNCQYIDDANKLKAEARPSSNGSRPAKSLLSKRSAN
jgi:hypothetical protein